MPLISVIITTYGKPIYLEKAIESVKQQTFTDFELIVVDDNDSNSINRSLTENVINKFSNIIYLKHDKNKNGAAARNTGIRESKGKYIAFLDSDDFYVSNRLERCYNAMEKISNKYAGVYTGCEFRRNNQKYHKFNKPKSGNFLIETLACTFKFSTGSNLFVRKSVVEELNGFDEHFLRHQDYEFLVRLFQKYDLYGIREILVIKNNENFNLPNVNKIISTKELYLDKYKNIILNLKLSKRKYVYYSQYISIALSALMNKDFDLYKKYLSLSKKNGLIKIWDILRIFKIKMRIKND